MGAGNPNPAARDPRGSPVSPIPQRHPFRFTSAHHPSQPKGSRERACFKRESDRRREARFQRLAGRSSPAARYASESERRARASPTRSAQRRSAEVESSVSSTVVGRGSAVVVPGPTRFDAAIRRQVRRSCLNLGDGVVGKATFEPGWRWSEHVRPLAGTDSGQAPQVAYVLLGVRRWSWTAAPNSNSGLQTWSRSHLA